ncbi:DNA-3-methyladenine glycosylase family protein [Microbacterium amylolyticum]|uniref:3-methyladenine DNA glycosylase/8-oxoguanine DNA glycosylase n=1 Tax=Microbacterium amylolyticum TaxID=936337 RepID=A0ABS4ZGA4_9MICO|nr:DNA-3-methyladenine glycosylase 2 family protein [Microbacterium amylolyticum]MBP2436316.1 3-methyladenine DNA glycosylase/8-oxoguanine DNA glycosylase [Microbacterium amylolyticum]
MDVSPLRTDYRPRRALDLAATAGVFQRGPGDPAQRSHAGVIWRATRTPLGAATTALAQRADGRVSIACWGPGAEWAIAQAPALCGAEDQPDPFDAARHPLIDATYRRNRGLLIARTDLVLDAVAQAIIEQKVTLRQAFGAWRRLVTRFGSPAPGPVPFPLVVPPSASGWRRIPSWAWHAAGLEPPQARTLVQTATRADSLIRAINAAPPDGQDAILQSLRGIGAWTSAEVRTRAFGDPDAVAVGDFHLSHHVGYALTGSRTDDDGMLALLEPWRGQRQRVIRLILRSGATGPRRGPRLHIEDHRSR